MSLSLCREGPERPVGLNTRMAPVGSAVLRQWTLYLEEMLQQAGDIHRALTAAGPENAGAIYSEALRTLGIEWVAEGPETTDAKTRTRFDNVDAVSGSQEPAADEPQDWAHSGVGVSSVPPGQHFSDAKNAMDSTENEPQKTIGCREEERPDGNVPSPIGFSKRKVLR